MHDYLLLPEVAELTRASLSTVRHWLREGRLPSVKPGRYRLVPRAAVVRMLTCDNNSTLDTNAVPPKSTALANGDLPHESTDPQPIF
jgi:excisionase family DNA binding protein